MPLARLSETERASINSLLEETLNKKVILERVRHYFKDKRQKQDDELVVPEAIDLLAQKLRTPLQIEQHLSLAFDEGHRMGEKPVSLAVVESILSKQMDDLEPTLTGHGYNVKSLSEQFNAKLSEIRCLFRGQLDPLRTRELQEQMLAAGLPL